MSLKLNNFNTSTMPADTVKFPQQAGSCSHLVLYNESGSGITLQWSSTGGSEFVPAHYVQTFQIPANAVSFDYHSEYALTGSPNDIVIPIYYGDSESLAGGWPSGPLSRLVSVGNQVSTTGTSSIINDGNVAPTEVVEATPAGGGGSKLIWNNDGSGTFGGGQITVDNTGTFTSLPPGAIPLAGLGSGALPAGVTLPATQVTAGALPAGVTLAVAQLVGTVGSAGSIGNIVFAVNDGTNHVVHLHENEPGGTARGWSLQSWDGAALNDILMLGSAATGAAAALDDSGNATFPTLAIGTPGGAAALAISASGIFTTLPAAAVPAASIAGGTLVAGVHQQDGAALTGMVNSGATPGRRIWIGPTDNGASAATGDVWVP